MIIRGLGVRGMSGLQELRVEDLGRVVRVGGPPRARQALFEALALALHSLTPGDCRAFRMMDIRATFDDGQVHIEDPEAMRARLGRDRTLKVRLDIELDPPLFGKLRELAVRDPELVDAIGAPLVLSLGWVFTNDFRICAPSRLTVRLGDLNLDDDRPWLPEFLALLEQRGSAWNNGDQNPPAVRRADRSHEPGRRAALEAMKQALLKPPWSLPELHVVDAGEEGFLALGPDIVPLRAWGPDARAGVGLCQAVHLDPAEIIALQNPTAETERPRAVRNWLVQQVEAAGSPLEQIWLFGEPNPTLSVEGPGPEEERPVPVVPR